MSRFLVGQVKFDDFEALCGALEGLFGKGTVERTRDGRNDLVAYGYQGDFREPEIGKVAAIVRRWNVGHFSNDLPIRREADGTFRLVVSAYDLGMLPRRLGWQASSLKEFEGRFAQVVGVCKARRDLPKLGYKLTETVLSTGVVKIHARAGAGKWS